MTRTSWIRTTATVTATLATFAVASPPASAASVSADGILNFFADEGEANNVTIAPTAAGEWEVTDSGAPLEAREGCRADGAVVRCSKTLNARIELDDGDDSAAVAGFADGYSPKVSGGDGNDTLRSTFSALLYGEDGDDVLEGGPQGDELSGGLGNDTIRARGGGTDSIECGPGRDTLEVDGSDKPLYRTYDGCEGDALVLPGVTQDSSAKLRGSTLKVTVKCSKPDCAGTVRPLRVEVFEASGSRKLGLRSKKFKLRGRKSSTVLRWKVPRSRLKGVRSYVNRGAELVVSFSLSDSVGHRTKGKTVFGIY